MKKKKSIKTIYLLIGAPGSGKTSAMESMNTKRISFYSIGAKYRRLSEENSELGKTIKSYIDIGQVVPLTIARKVIERFVDEGMERIVIDASPRDMEQALMFEKAIEGKAELKGVIELMVDEQEALNRITERARGTDDDPKKFKDRMRVYNNEINELRAFYKSQEKYISIESEEQQSKIVEKLRRLINS